MPFTQSPISEEISPTAKARSSKRRRSELPADSSAQEFPSKRPRHDNVASWLRDLPPLRCPPKISCIDPTTEYATPAHSMPTMSRRSSVNGDMPPPSTQSTSRALSSDTTITKTNAGEASYRNVNLHTNQIYLEKTYTELPTHVQALVDHMTRSRDSLTLDPKAWEHDAKVMDAAQGGPEHDVVDFAKERFFTVCQLPLKRSESLLMKEQYVPRNPASFHRLTVPKPDFLYGYDRINSFDKSQQLAIANRNLGAANTSDVLFPFLTVELKGDGPQTKSSMWCADNQVLGGAATCTNIIKRLQRLAGSREAQLSTTTFGITMSNTDANFYVMWSEEDGFKMRLVKRYSFQHGSDAEQFRRVILNTLDWAQGQRLQELRGSIECLQTPTSSTSKSRGSSLADSTRDKRRKSRHDSDVSLSAP